MRVRLFGSKFPRQFPRLAFFFLFMANAEQPDLLQQGTAIWNDWRIRNPGSLPDLSGATSSGAHRGGEELVYEDLSAADLRGANFD